MPAPALKAVLVTSLSCISTWISAASTSIQHSAADLGSFANSAYYNPHLLLPNSIERAQLRSHSPTAVLVAVPQEFKAALSSLPQASLNAVLHSHLPHYKEGIFEKDHKAVEEIYKRSPAMAKELVAAARYDVLRRQNGNITTTSASTMSTGTPITLTATDAGGSTYLTTFTPVGGVYTSQIIQTSTLGDGSPTTFTSVTVVPAPTQSSPSDGKPSLQNSAPSTYGMQQHTITLTGVMVLALSFAGILMA